MPDMPEPEAASHDLRDDLTELLDQELSRLPEKYRIPIVLCELEGRTHKEAASQLGWPIGTVSSRLSRARSMLARRLSRQGVSLSVGSLAVLLAQESASASMPTRLIDSTAQAASLFAAGGALTAGVVSAEVTALTGEVLKIMLLSKLKITAAVLLMGVTLTVVGTSLAYQEKPSKEGTGGSDQRRKLAAQKGVVVPALPGERHSVFGGGPNEPRYMRHGNLFFVTSPLGDKFSIYDAATNKASTVRLPGSKESSLQVTPIIGAANISFADARWAEADPALCLQPRRLEVVSSRPEGARRWNPVPDLGPFGRRLRPGPNHLCLQHRGEAVEHPRITPGGSGATGHERVLGFHRRRV